MSWRGSFYINDWLARDYANNLSAGFSRINNGKKREYTEYICTGELAKGINVAGYTTEYNAYYPGTAFCILGYGDRSVSASGSIAVHTGCIAVSHNKSQLVYNAMDVGRSGYYITDGKMIQVGWAKVGENTPTVYFDKLTGNCCRSILERLT